MVWVVTKEYIELEPPVVVCHHDSEFAAGDRINQTLVLGGSGFRNHVHGPFVYGLNNSIMACVCKEVFSLYAGGSVKACSIFTTRCPNKRVNPTDADRVWLSEVFGSGLGPS